MKLFRLCLILACVNAHIFAMQQSTEQTIYDSTRPEEIINTLKSLLKNPEIGSASTQIAAKILSAKHANIKGINNSTGWTALHIAAFYGLCNEIKILIAAGINIDTTDLFGQTALHVATEAGQAKALQVLLDLGANINLVDNNSKIVLDLAVENGRRECAQILVNQYYLNKISIPEYIISSLNALLS